MGSPQTIKEIEAISSALKEDLCCEILWSAMQYLKQNPNSTIEDAINYGFGEWIK